MASRVFFLKCESSSSAIEIGFSSFYGIRSFGTCLLTIFLRRSSQNIPFQLENFVCPWDPKIFVGGGPGFDPDICSNFDTDQRFFFMYMGEVWKGVQGKQLRKKFLGSARGPKFWFRGTDVFGIGQNLGNVWKFDTQYLNSFYLKKFGTYHREWIQGYVTLQFKYRKFDFYRFFIIFFRGHNSKCCR